MKTVAILLCLVSAVAAMPMGFLSGFLGQGSKATGSAAGNVVSAVSGGPNQNTRITQVSASAKGSASGNAVSTNAASASNAHSSGIFGSQDLSNTNAVSNQQTFDGRLFGGIQQPGYQSQNNGYRRQNTGYQSQNNGYRRQNTGYQSQNNGYRRQNNGYQSQNSGYRRQNNGYQFQNSGYRPQNIGHRRQNTGYHPQQFQRGNLFQHQSQAINF